MEELLMSVHAFLDRLGVDEVRQRGAQDDKPLRMVKTLLHELCKGLVGSRALPCMQRMAPEAGSCRSAALLPSVPEQPAHCSECTDLGADSNVKVDRRL